MTYKNLIIKIKPYREYKQTIELKQPKLNLGTGSGYVSI
jgi:hypothetical protein